MPLSVRPRKTANAVSRLADQVILCRWRDGVIDTTKWPCHPAAGDKEHGATNRVRGEAAAISIDVRPQIRRRLRLATIKRPLPLSEPKPEAR